MKVWYEVEVKLHTSDKWKRLDPQPRSQSADDCRWCEDTSLKSKYRIVKVTETREVVE